MNGPIMLELPGLTPTPLTAELVAQLEGVLRQHKQQKSASRDLTREIQAFLTGRPGASTVEIARGIRARDTSVRDVLHHNPIFERGCDARQVGGRAKRWTVAASPGEPVPARGTTSPGSDRAR